MRRKVSARGNKDFAVRRACKQVRAQAVFDDNLLRRVRQAMNDDGVVPIRGSELRAVAPRGHWIGGRRMVEKR